MREVSCCFSGHRPDKLAFGYDESHPDCIAMKQGLFDCIGSLISQGFSTFYGGMAQGSDIYCAEAVLVHRKNHPGIRFVAVAPYLGQEKRWSTEYQHRYQSILEQADEALVLNQRYHRGCMMQRNRYMVDRSNLLVAIYSGESGGTKRTLQYAVAKGLTILWFNPQTQLWTRMTH